MKLFYMLSVALIGIAPWAVGQEENQKCFGCHGHASFMAFPRDSTEGKKLRMCAEYRIDPAKYANATHGKLACTACHDRGHLKTLHDSELKFSEGFDCLDCHGGNKKFAKYNFEGIAVEARKSVHFKKLSEFSCFSCHDPHTFRRTFTRDAASSKEAIEVSNEMCGSCHGDQGKLAAWTDRKVASLAEAHAWLPLSEHHLKNLRCADCHGEINNRTASMHNIVPAEKAVRECRECHAATSRLTTTLYKHQAQEERRKYGFLNSAIMNNAYVVGATRNRYFNIASVGVFACIIIGLAGHFALLKISRRKNKK